MMQEEDLISKRYKLTGEVFARKDEVAAQLTVQRDECRRREQTFGRSGASRLVRWSIAAAVAVVIGASGWFAAQTSIVAPVGGMSITLPDHSQVAMEQGATVEYNRLAWIFTRAVRLDGEARFEVSKGGRFSVRTEVGSVTVLGTVFTVNAADSTMQVECLEGRVEVASRSGHSAVLNKGEKIDCTADGVGEVQTIDEEVQPVEEEPVQPQTAAPQVARKAEPKQSAPRDYRAAVAGYEAFDNAPLVTVAAKIEQLYSVTVAGTQLCEGLRYSGLMATGDVTAALEMTMGACGIGYQFNGSEIVLTSHAEASAFERHGTGEKSLTEILQRLSQRYKTVISYSPTLTDNIYPSANLAGNDLYTLLDEALEQNKVSYRVISGNNLYIYSTYPSAATNDNGRKKSKRR